MVLGADEEEVGGEEVMETGELVQLEGEGAGAGAGLYSLETDQGVGG